MRRPPVPALALLASTLGACGTTDLDLRPPAPATLAAVRELAPHPCNATTAAALDALRVSPDDLRSLYYDRRVTGNESGQLRGYDAWIGRRGGAPGLVVRHTRSCRFITSLVS